MQDPRTRAATTRIEQALGRLETALSAEPQPSAEAEELERMRSAHALLRRRVEAAIGEIDSMLGTSHGAAG